MSMPCWPCATWPVMTVGRKAGTPSGAGGASKRWPHEPNERCVPLHLVRVPHLLGRRYLPQRSLPPPVSHHPSRSLPSSRRPIIARPHHLNLVLCVLLRPIRGDALFCAVVPLSREVWVLQKSHAHPISWVRFIFLHSSTIVSVADLTHPNL